MENKTLGLFFSSSNWISACLIPRLSKVRPSDERANVWNSCRKNDRLGGTTGRVMFTWQTLERAVRKHKSGNLGLRLCADGNPTQLLLEVGKVFTWILNFGEFPCSELAFYPNENTFLLDMVVSAELYGRLQWSVRKHWIGKPGLGIVCGQEPTKRQGGGTGNHQLLSASESSNS